MPELPEVESWRRLAQRVAVGRRIDSVEVDPDEIVFAGHSVEEMTRALSGARVEGAVRRGKYLWLELDRRPWPLLHFGMTGRLHVPGVAALPLAASAREEAPGWPPRFTKLRIRLEDGGELAMTNARRLGRVRLQLDPSRELPVSQLGFDALTNLPDSKSFHQLVADRRGVVKGLLLNQRFAAGVGNWIADEVLYRSGIAPTRTVGSLSAEEVESLRLSLREVVETAASVDADKDRFPKDWLFHQRWGRRPDATLPSGEVIEFTTVSGRTTAWVPARQS